MRIFQKYFDKHWDCLPPVVRSALKPSQVGFDMYRFGWYEREVQENSVAREWPRLRFWKCAPFSKKLLSPYVLPAFFDFVDFDGPWVLRMEKRSSGMYIRCHRVSESAQEWLWRFVRIDDKIEKLDIFHEFLTFLESFQAPSRQFLGCK